MVAVRTTARCANCRRKKIKCDENWPACGACQHSQLSCPGPPGPTYRFIGGGTFRSTGGASCPGVESEEATLPPQQQLRQASDSPSLVLLRQRAASQGGAAFLKLRSNSAVRALPPSCNPESPLQSPADRARLQLVVAIESGLKGDGPDFCVKNPWIHLVPQRLAQSPALRDATRLLLTAVSNRQRGFPFGAELDRGMYVRCIASLRSALTNPKEKFNSETMAALLLMTKIEIDHEEFRNPNQSSHWRGLSALLAARGPPSLSDQFDIQVCFDSMGVLITQFLVNHERNFFTCSEWQSTLSAAVQSCRNRDGRRQKGYRLDLIMVRWPDLVEQLSHARFSSGAELAARLIVSIGEVRRDLAAFEAEVIDPLLGDGTIWKTPGSGGSCDAQFRFADWWACQVFVGHALTSLAMCRILSAAIKLTGQSSHSVEHQSLAWSKRIWECLCYAEGLTREQQEFFLAPIVLSYASAADDRRQWVMTKLRQISGPRVRFLESRAEDVVLAMCEELTERGAARPWTSSALRAGRAHIQG